MQGIRQWLAAFARLTAIITIIASTSGVVGVADAVQASASEIITEGPLTRILTTPDLNCAVSYAGDTAEEFYGSTACGTFVAVSGTLFGPQTIPAGGNASPRTAFTPISQVGPTGSGTAASPFRVVTRVALGATGIELTQTDSYIRGQQSYSTTAQLRNTSSASRAAIVYRAGDCYVANSDFGKGSINGASVACVAETGRVAQWIPVSPGSRYMEGFYGAIWAAIGSQMPFANTCDCGASIDNGAGLSWSLSLAAAGSATVSHRTAFSASHELSDTDGDGLLDDWETSGLDVDGDGQIDVDLPAMGAKPDHKDVFLEIDWMERPQSCLAWVICWGGQNFAPNQTAVADVVQAFAMAPVPNPDGAAGIRLHVDAGQNTIMDPISNTRWGSRSKANRVPYSQQLGSYSGDEYNWSAFDGIRAANFDIKREDVFHYAVFGDTYAGSESSGIARGIPGADFLVTDGPSGSTGFSRRQESGTLMHELGHTLGLKHGGVDHAHHKPNYLSIMNYLFQMKDLPLGYSTTLFDPLNESSLSESTGLVPAPLAAGKSTAWYCPNGNRVTGRADRPIDWDCDGQTDTSPVQVDISGNGTRSTLDGFVDWPSIVFDGGPIGVFSGSDLEDQEPPPATTELDESSVDELREMNAFGEDGDGTVAHVGPSVVLAGIEGQKVQFDVTNVGNVAATYQLSIAPSIPGIGTDEITVEVEGLETSRVAIEIDASHLAPNTYQGVVRLAGPGGAELSTGQVTYIVPDLNDPEQRALAAEALRQLRSSETPGLDPAVKSALDAALTNAVAQPAPTTTSSPAVTSTQTAPSTAVTSSTAPPAQGSGGGLSQTGPNVRGLFGLAVLLIGIGGGFVVIARRRRRRQV